MNWSSPKASEFYDAEAKLYDLGKWYPQPERDADPSLKMTVDELIVFYEKLLADFPNIVTIEDPFDQDDFEAWTKLTAKMGQQVQIVGDDLTVTNIERVKKAIDEKQCNALLLKVNQIGSISEAINAVKISKQNGWGIMTSHRSGETEDNYIGDLAVGLCAGQIKTGAPCRSERTAKYNQMMRIEEELGTQASYASGGDSFEKARKPVWMG